jgi:hypothetical protein
VQKIASAIVAFFCLLLILVVFFGKSISSGTKLFVAVASFIILSAVYLSSRKSSNRSGIKNLTKAEGQKVLDDNIDWLRKRWDRLQNEKDSGLLRTVSSWYFDDATDKQLSLIKRIGLNLSTAMMTRGQASDIIELYEPAEEKKIAILKKHKVPLDGMNQTKAGELLATLLDNLVETNSGIIHTTEHLIIKKLADDFIYFVRFFDSRARYNEVSPEYVPKDDRSRIRYEQAAQLGLALKGVKIPLEEKLKTLELNQLSSLAGGQKFSRKAPAIEILMDIPDIVDRLESMAPIEDWFQLRRVKLDVGYLETKWSKLRGTDQ